MDLWLELLQIASSVVFNEEHDTLIWKYNSTGRFSMQSLYGIVADMGTLDQKLVFACPGGRDPGVLGGGAGGKKRHTSVDCVVLAGKNRTKQPRMR
jgi:hypothetical protein